MKLRPRIYYTETQKALMWEHWQKGDSLQHIAQLFDRSHGSIRPILAESGGIRPAQRHRSRLSLTLAEREEISRAVVAGQSARSIATSLGRAPSTISREIKRNGGQECYRASIADQAAWDRAHRLKTCKLAENRTLAHIVADKLQWQWSPEQIAGWLKQTYPSDESYQVSHETRKSFWRTCGVRESCAARAIIRRRQMITAGSPTPCRSVRVRPRLKSARYRVTGKGICYAEAVTVRLRPSSNARRAM